MYFSNPAFCQTFFCKTDFCHAPCVTFSFFLLQAYPVVPRRYSDFADLLIEDEIQRQKQSIDYGAFKKEGDCMVMERGEEDDDDDDEEDDEEDFNEEEEEFSRKGGSKKYNSCGMTKYDDDDDRIVGGSESEVAKFPWMVALKLRYGRDVDCCTYANYPLMIFQERHPVLRRGPHIQNGWNTLSRFNTFLPHDVSFFQYVLTAAHCIAWGKGALKIVLSIGDHDLAKDSEIKSITRKVGEN